METGEPASVVYDEAALIKRARLGDAVAFARLVERHQMTALRSARAILTNPDDAQDAVQEAFIKAFYALPRFKIGRNFRPWLLQIVTNQALNALRAAGRRDARELRAYVPLAAPSAEADVLSRERRLELLDALSSLNKDDSTVLGYRYFQDLSEAEMAVTLGISRGTVKSRLSRALERLRGRVTREILLLLAFLLLAAGLLAARPDLREALAERLGLRGAQITHVASVPTNLGTALGLGRPTTLEDGRRSVSFPVVLPTTVGEPDEVYFQDSPPGGQVALVYAPRGEILRANTTGVGLLLTEFQASLHGVSPIGKGLPPGTRLEEVTVNGARGYWIEGDPHVFMFQDTQGHIQAETTRLAANVLLWERGPITLRLESSIGKESALAIAESTR